MCYMIITGGSLVWFILSLIADMFVITAIVTPKWLIGPSAQSFELPSQVVLKSKGVHNNETIATTTTLKYPSVGIYTRCKAVNDMGSPHFHCGSFDLDGFATDSEIYPSAWKATMFFISLGFVLLTLTVLSTLISCCRQAIFGKSLHNMTACVQVTADHTWVSTNVYEDLPPFAIHAGHDSDGDPIYVGRAYHNGDMLPAKVIPNKKQAYVAWGGEEHNKHDVEILTGHHYVWIPSSGGHVPPHALRVGQTGDGEPLYVGRGHWAGSLTPGKIHPSHGCLYIPYGGGEHKLEHYEVLVQPETWVSSSGGHIVPGTIHAGSDSDGDAIYVGRAYHDGDLLPAKVIPSKGCAYVAYGGEEHVKHDFELLAGYGYGWVPDSNGSVPPGAVVCGRTSDGEPLYIGRGHWSGSLTPGKIHPPKSA